MDEISCVIVPTRVAGKRPHGVRTTGRPIQRKRRRLAKLIGLLDEAVAGILQRPVRTALTALGTVLGVGAFVGVLGLASTTAGQISQRFTALLATEVTIEEVASDTNSPTAFPVDADARIRRISGAFAAASHLHRRGPFTVIGVVDDVRRNPAVLFSVLVPRGTAEELRGTPSDQDDVTMLIETEVGAAQVVAEQAALALRPDAPELLRVLPPPEPSSLREDVASDFADLFLLLAAVCLFIGAAGIANTTSMAVLERTSEIGVRRALGASRRSIAAQFLLESSAIGTAAGLAGTVLGLILVVAVSFARDWTPVVETWVFLPAPLAGTLVGLLAGAYPAAKAARLEPVDALRR